MKARHITQAQPLEASAPAPQIHLRPNFRSTSKIVRCQGGRRTSFHLLAQLLAFSPGKEQAAGVWETCLAPGPSMGSHRVGHD